MVVFEICSVVLIVFVKVGDVWFVKIGSVWGVAPADAGCMCGDTSVKIKDIAFVFGEVFGDKTHIRFPVKRGLSIVTINSCWSPVFGGCLLKYWYDVFPLRCFRVVFVVIFCSLLLCFFQPCRGIHLL